MNNAPAAVSETGTGARGAAEATTDKGATVAATAVAEAADPGRATAEGWEGGEAETT